jgi:hypothetical protein
MPRYNWDGSDDRIESLKQAVQPARERVVNHPIYRSINSLPAVLTFMEHHVFAVWDFMSLLKSLQRELTCVQVPWVPTQLRSSRRLINDIVLVEESDELGDGFISHFELYLEGMTQAGADRNAVDSFLSLVQAGKPVLGALQDADVPKPAIEFASQTWDFIEQAPVHCRAAAFAFGREDLIPDMFDQVVSVNRELGDRLSNFVDYLERHIQVDSEEHTPMAMQMLADLCDTEEKWKQAEETINTALAARCQLWDGILAAINA